MNTKDDKAFKPIQSPVILDFSSCKTWQELHTVLKNGFGLPNYYGENWDALQDCLDGLFDERGTFKIYIRGIRTMPAALRKYAEGMFEVFRDVQELSPNAEFITES